VQKFEYALEDNILQLHGELQAGTYACDPYAAFTVCDSKPRRIHKATVRDRVLHQAIFRVLYPLFDRRFIADSYSCRVGKGTHRGAARLHYFLRTELAKRRGTVFALKCDIRKFFDSVDHGILISLLREYVADVDTLRLLAIIIRSFSITPAVGLPLGNVTSQLFANIYLHELDCFLKYELRVDTYVRYSDDFAVVGNDPLQLRFVAEIARYFLKNRLNLDLHEKKLVIRKYLQGVDFLGYVLFPCHKVIRTRTKRRMLKRIAQGTLTESALHS
jgi:RNA-directed DNA polymerase